MAMGLEGTGVGERDDESDSGSVYYDREAGKIGVSERNGGQERCELGDDELDESRTERTMGPSCSTEDGPAIELASWAAIGREWNLKRRELRPGTGPTLGDKLRGAKVASRVRSTELRPVVTSRRTF